MIKIVQLTTFHPQITLQVYYNAVTLKFKVLYKEIIQVAGI